MADFCNCVQENVVPNVTMEGPLEEEEVNYEGGLARHSSVQVRSGDENWVVGVNAPTAYPLAVAPTVDIVAGDNDEALQWEWPPYEYHSEDIPTDAIDNIRAELAQLPTNGKSTVAQEDDPQLDGPPRESATKDTPSFTIVKAGASVMRLLTNGETGYERGEDDPKSEWHSCEDIPPCATVRTPASLGRRSMIQLHHNVRGSCLVQIMCSLSAAFVLANFWESVRT